MPKYVIGRQYLVTTQSGVAMRRTFLGSVRDRLQWGGEIAGRRFTHLVSLQNPMVQSILPVAL